MNIPIVALSLITILLALPLLTGRVARNRYYGVRVRETMEDATVWKQANHLWGLTSMLSALTTLILDSWLAVHNIPVALRTTAELLSFGLGVSLSVVICIMFVKKRPLK